MAKPDPYQAANQLFSKPPSEQKPVANKLAPDLPSAMSKIEPQHVAVILLIVVAYTLLNLYIRVLLDVIVVLVWIASYNTISELKRRPTGNITDNDKWKAVCFIAFAPVVVQAFYYYRLHKIHEGAAKTYLRLDWKVVITEIICGLIVIIPLALIIKT